MPIYDQIKAEVDSIIVRAKQEIDAAKADGKVTVGEELAIASRLLTQAVGSFVKLAKSLDATGAGKKETVIQAAEQFYDAILAPIDLPWIPNLIEPLVDRTIRSAIRPALDGMIEGIYRLLEPAL